MEESCLFAYLNPGGESRRSLECIVRSFSQKSFIRVKTFPFWDKYKYLSFYLAQ